MSAPIPPLRPPQRTPRQPRTLPGWDLAWQHTLDAVPRPPGARPARVVRVDKGACEVLWAHDEGVHPVTARWSPAITRAAAADPTSTPAAGDWVLCEPHAHVGADLLLTTVLPRRTAVTRLGVDGSSQAQVLAANADVVAVVQAMVPDLDLGRIERLLGLAWASGAEPVVLLTKADLHPDPATALATVAPSAAGCPVYALATLAGTGLEPLHARLADGATLALLGASGVGKSTLLNALVGGEVMATRTLGVEGKGRHTTVTRELHLVPGGGAVLDTPGLRSVGLAGGEDVADLFPEVDELAAGCRFADCGHTVEPGCAVQAALTDGTLPQRRLDSYRDLRREVDYQARRADARLRAEHVRELKARTRDYRRRPDKRR